MTSIPLLRLLGLVLALCVGSTALAQPLPLRDLHLVDARGKSLNPQTLRGQVVLMHFVFTGCSATCPTQVRELQALHEALPSSLRGRVRFLSVSLDPNDTPASLAAFARRHQADRPGWQFVRGPAEDIDLLASRMQAFDPARPTAGLDAHRTSLYLHDARGQLVQRFAGVPVDRPRLLHELSLLAVQAAPPSPQFASPQ